eukprot:CAMPEP_0182441358 /NCGR_PEP_ID=MMETSP1172-20130603/284_1 /TAXON_ID=708627 /ORGANISM="Timspurckia oligopyrenoides, Strain CCMP3278" /LENGTH=227 /DNA_ID=CAMNT_0024635565 /DNA_START=72 /DNA_END=755 /DNA_ORIENTATION=+
MSSGAFVGGCGTSSLSVTELSGKRVICGIRSVSRSVVVPSSRRERHSLVMLVVGVDTTLEEAIWRIKSALPEYTEKQIKDCLDQYKGDDEKALDELIRTSTQLSEAQEKRIEEYRKKGRISASQEAQLRRRVIGSAKDFFKSYIEVKGEYVDQGYVDEKSDVMGGIMSKVSGFFGLGGNKEVLEEKKEVVQEKKAFVPRVSEIVAVKKEVKEEYVPEVRKKLMNKEV